MRVATKNLKIGNGRKHLDSAFLFDYAEEDIDELPLVLSVPLETNSKLRDDWAAKFASVHKFDGVDKDLGIPQKLSIFETPQDAAKKELEELRADLGSVPGRPYAQKLLPDASGAASDLRPAISQRRKKESSWIGPPSGVIE